MENARLQQVMRNHRVGVFEKEKKVGGDSDKEQGGRELDTGLDAD